MKQDIVPRLEFIKELGQMEALRLASNISSGHLLLTGHLEL